MYKVYEMSGHKKHAGKTYKSLGQLLEELQKECEVIKFMKDKKTGGWTLFISECNNTSWYTVKKEGDRI